MNYKFKISQIFVFAFLLTIFTKCTEGEEPSGNIFGTLSFEGNEYNVSGGLLDEAIYNADSSRRSIRFQISQLPISQSWDTLTFYRSSGERISFQFILASANDSLLKAGVYQFQNIKSEDPILPPGRLLYEAYVFTGTGPGIVSSVTFHEATSGTVVLSGIFPQYSIDINMNTDNSPIIGKVSGVFITRESWDEFFK